MHFPYLHSDLTKQFDVQQQTNRDMIIPRNVGDYYIQKVVQETNNSLLVSALYKNDKKVAIKCVPPQFFNPKLPEILSKLNHPNILPTYDVFEYPENNKRFFGIVMPFVETDLFSYFFSDNNGFLSERKVCRLMKEALSAVSYFHSLGYCHSDLKIENFLVMNPRIQPKILLIDFDYSFRLPNGYILRNLPRGTLPNAAPELLDDDRLAFKQEAAFTNKIDTWSMGVVLYILLTGSHPFQASKDTYDLSRIKDGYIDLSDRRFPNVSIEARNLIKCMINPDPNQRITIEDALRHNWFNLFLRNGRNIPPDHRFTFDDDFDDDFFIDG